MDLVHSQGVRLLIAEFVKATGLSRDTVRFYVKKGLLRPTVPSDAANRYQHFANELVVRARLIRTAQSLGFTLKDIAELADEFDNGGLGHARQIELLQARMALIDERLHMLQSLQGYIAAKIAWLDGGAAGDSPDFDGSQTP